MKTIFYQKVPEYPKNTPIFRQKSSSMKKAREGLVVLKIPKSRICNNKRVVGVFRGEIRGHLGGISTSHPKRPHQRGLPFHNTTPIQ